MRKNVFSELETIQVQNQIPGEPLATLDGLPNRLLTAFEVAEFVGCHEETVRRAYLRGVLVSQRFGVSWWPISSLGSRRSPWTSITTFGY